jgi:hypothetical protein
MTCQVDSPVFDSPIGFQQADQIRIGFAGQGRVEIGMGVYPVGVGRNEKEEGLELAEDMIDIDLAAG